MTSKSPQETRNNMARQQRLPLWGEERDEVSTEGDATNPDASVPPDPTPEDAPLPLPAAEEPSAKHPEDEPHPDEEPFALEALETPSPPAGPADEPEPARQENIEEQDDSGAETTRTRAEHHPPRPVAPTAEIIDLGPLEIPVGQALMEARAEAGLTVAEVSAKTFLSKAAVEDLETGHLERIPTLSHCQSHIKKLCGIYGIKAEPLLNKLAEEYERLAGRGGTGGALAGLVSQETESGAILTPSPPGGGGPTEAPRPGSMTGLLMRIVIVAFVLLVAGALITQHIRNRQQQKALGEMPTELPPVELQDFIVPQDLRLEELPIPKR